MNSREKVVLVVLTVAFLVGTGLALLKKWNLIRRTASSPIVIENVVDTTQVEERLLDLNQAKKYELEALPGIGPVLAQRIIDYRDRHGGFKTVSQLRNVSGIGPKRYAAIKDLVTVSLVRK